MKLTGSCHCQAVKFSLNSKHPYPFNICYCSICRKTNGSGGFAINLSGSAESLKLDGKAFVSIYQARIFNEHSGDMEESPAQRHFCSKCGSHLYVWDPRWPELIHPHASAIDSKLPAPPEHTHLMLAHKADWVEPCLHKGDKQFAQYPDESIEQWHKRLGLEQD